MSFIIYKHACKLLYFLYITENRVPVPGELSYRLEDS